MNYFRTIIFNGEKIDFSHLNPFIMAVNSLKAKRDLFVEVKFTVHCFSESYSGVNMSCAPDGYPKFHDGGNRQRIFSKERYDLSQKYLLPMIKSVIATNVFATKTIHRRNWVFYKEIKLENGYYSVFFEIRKKTRDAKVISHGNVDLIMTVESAYKMPQEPDKGQKINFGNLCGKIYLGEKIK